jgi:hypothetical protein
MNPTMNPNGKGTTPGSTGPIEPNSRPAESGPTLATQRGNARHSVESAIVGQKPKFLVACFVVRDGKVFFTVDTWDWPAEDSPVVLQLLKEDLVKRGAKIE